MKIFNTQSLETIEARREEAFSSTAKTPLTYRDELSGQVQQSFLQRYVVAPFQTCFQWIRSWFCCCKEQVQAVTKEETQRKQLDQLIKDFPTNCKASDTFKVWWKNAFEQLDKDLQEMILEEDLATRGRKNHQEAHCFVVELQQFMDDDGKIPDPVKEIPKYLEAVKMALEKG